MSPLFATGLAAVSATIAAYCLLGAHGMSPKALGIIALFGLIGCADGDKSKPIDAPVMQQPACGKLGLGCCTDTPACSGQNKCCAGKCVDTSSTGGTCLTNMQMGGPGQPCLPGNHCNSASNTCCSGTCVDTQTNAKN